MLTLFCSPALASQPFPTTVSAQRPAGVPSDYVVTPFGYMHPSCVMGIDANESVQGALIQRTDGSTRPIVPCTHPRFGGGPSAPGGPPPTINNWVEWGDNASFGPIDFLVGWWTVPNGPGTADGQTIYMFNGLEPSDGSFILQPVLAWDGWNDNRYTMTDWRCCVNGTALHDNPLTISAVGEQIEGYVEGFNCGGSGVCSTWAVGYSCSDGSGAFFTDSQGKVLDWMFGGALEVYDVWECPALPFDQPSEQGVVFSNTFAQTTSGTYIHPTWSHEFGQTTNPSCSFGISGPQNALSLNWNGNYP